MKIYPSTAGDKLGFDILRERLDELTLSRLGQVRLSNMKPSGQINWVREELGRVSELQDAFRFDDAVPLEHVLDVRDVIRRITPIDSFAPPEDLLAVRLVLSSLRRTRSYFETRAHKYPHLVRTVSRIVPLQGIEHQIGAVVDDDGRLREDASPELRRIRRLVVQRQGALRETLMNELRKATGQGFATEEQPTMRNGRMVIPVRVEAKRKVQGFVQDVSATGQTVYVEPASCLELNNEIRELESEERREVERILREVTESVRQHLEEMKENVKALAQFDLLQAKARLSIELDAVVPHLNESGVMDIRKGRNPVLLLRFRRLAEEGGEARSVVPLHVVLGEDYRTLIITGPNAGGKTVAMKTVGLMALMLSYGMPIPVDPLSNCCVFRSLIVDIGDEQSIEEDLSTFSSHVTNLKYMLRTADSGTLILIDEAGTGTDPAEGGALAQAVLEALTRAGARTIATTHHGTLKVFAHETEGVENGSMQFDQATLSPTYRFQARIPGSSYAFEIARRIGLDGRVLDRARVLAGDRKSALEDLIATFETRNKELEDRLNEAEVSIRRANEEKSRYEEQHQSLRDRTDELRRKALEEAEQIVSNANARVERTIREIRESQAEKEATRLARERIELFREDVKKRREDLERRKRPVRKAPARQAGQPEGRGKGSGPIRIGDQVVLDEGSTVAEVVELYDGEAAVTFGSMRMRVKLERLQRVGGPRKQQVSIHTVVSTGGGSELPVLGTRNTIDLRGKRVDEALQEVEQLLDRALAANLDRVEILHGKGTGALRQAVHEYLARRPDVRQFEDAPWNQGGAGVTYVDMK